jgi:hypothetical protein
MIFPAINKAKCKLPLNSGAMVINVDQIIPYHSPGVENVFHGQALAKSSCPATASAAAALRSTFTGLAMAKLPKLAKLQS